MAQPALRPINRSGTREADLDQISFYLGRAYYTYVGLRERVLKDMGLDQHIRPGMGNVLFALFEHDDQTISEVAQRLKLAKSTMTGIASCGKPNHVERGRQSSAPMSHVCVSGAIIPVFTKSLR